MTKSMLKSGTVGLALAAGLAVGLTAAALPTPAVAAATKAAGVTLNLSQGRGQIIRLSRPMSDLFVADDKVADVQVRSSTVLYVFGKGPGVTTVSATDKAGRVVYSANVQVGNNFDRLGTMLSLAMPESHVTATPMNGHVLLTGTVGSPDDVEQATQLITSFVGPNVQVVNRLKTAVPLQVNLHVKIAEVSREFAKTIGVNLLAQSSNSNGFHVRRRPGQPRDDRDQPGSDQGADWPEAQPRDSIRRWVPPPLPSPAMRSAWTCSRRSISPRMTVWSIPLPSRI